jgi:prevent-host-death family protein
VFIVAGRGVVLRAPCRLRICETKRQTGRIDVARIKMTIYDVEMDISVTEFKQRCLEIIRRVEKTGQAVAITRRGRVVARVSPSSAAAGADAGKPWEQVRALGGRLLAGPGESALRDEEFEALR